MILPPPRGIMWRATAWERKNAVFEIHIHDRIPVGFGEFERFAPTDSAGVVDQDVDPSQASDHACHDLVADRRRAQIRFDMKKSASRGLHEPGRLGSRAATDDGNVGARCGQRDCDRLPYPRVGPRDESDAAGQLEGIGHILHRSVAVGTPSMSR